MAEHKDLPNSQLHEPKDVSSASSGAVYIADGSGSGTWTRPSAWSFYKDGTYTEASPRTLTADTTYKLTIDGTGDAQYNGLSTLWDTSDNFALVEGTGYLYDTRLQMKIATNVNSGYITIEYRAKDATEAFYTEQRSIGKTDETNFVGDNFTYFGGTETVTAGGVEIYITSTVAATLWDASILVHRSHIPV